MAKPIYFEIPAEDPQRAMDFYTAVFGWTFTKWDAPMPYWVIQAGDDSEPGINGGLMARQHPDQPCVNTVTVADLDATVATVVQSGGAIAVPKMPVPGVGWLAYCKDVDGHIFGIMQSDTSVDQS